MAGCKCVYQALWVLYWIYLPRTRTRQRDTMLAVNVRNNDLRGFAVMEIMGSPLGDCERIFATPFGKYIATRRCRLKHRPGC